MLQIVILSLQIVLVVINAIPAFRQGRKLTSKESAEKREKLIETHQSVNYLTQHQESNLQQLDLLKRALKQLLDSKGLDSSSLASREVEEV